MIKFVTWKILLYVVRVYTLFVNLHFMCEQQHRRGAHEKVSHPCLLYPT